MHCAVCGSERLSPSGTLLTGHGNVASSWVLAGESGWFKASSVVTATLAVVCGDCGYFMLFAKSADLEDARSKWDRLTAAG